MASEEFEVDDDKRSIDGYVRTCQFCLFDISRKHPGATWRLAWGGSEDDPFVCASGPWGFHQPGSDTSVASASNGPETGDR
jgi:hypothetical protein